MPSEQSAKQYYDALSQAVSQFTRAWPSLFNDIRMYEIPAYPRHKRRNLVPDEIMPIQQNGEVAVELAKRSLKQFKRTSYQNPLSVIRFPGWVSTTQAVIDDITVINELKNGLQETIKLLEPDEAARIALTRRLFPGVSMLQVYRTIACHHRPVVRIEFTWSPMTMATRKLDKTKVIQQLESSLTQSPPPEYENKHTWRAVVERELREISALGEGDLVLRKPIAPHPKVMVYFGGDEGKRSDNKYDEIHNASLPVFIRSDHSLAVSDLKTFYFDRTRTPNTKVGAFRWISKPLGLAARV